MSRASSADVRAIIDSDTALNLSPFIEAASGLVDYIVTQDANSIMSAAQLRKCETWLAAHFYAHRDPQYSTKSTEKASANFQGQTAMYLDSTVWGQTAKVLDLTGTLAKLDDQARTGKVRKATLTWLGLPPSGQTDYTERD